MHTWEGKTDFWRGTHWNCCDGLNSESLCDGFVQDLWLCGRYMYTCWKSVWTFHQISGSCSFRRKCVGINLRLQWFSHRRQNCSHVAFVLLIYRLFCFCNRIQDCLNAEAANRYTSLCVHLRYKDKNGFAAWIKFGDENLMELSRGVLSHGSCVPQPLL